MSVRRRQVLAVTAASLALAVAGCSPMAMARKRRKRKVQQYLSGLDAGSRMIRLWDRCRQLCGTPTPRCCA